ncbi:MAG: UbiA family prenyltransferase [Verrucomicrobia bacterium]|nr:UbiA family prenyltransferase [Verrucomicrobiota bacterium]
MGLHHPRSTGERRTLLRRSGRPNWFRSLSISIYLLELVGASAITALGCVACNFMQVGWSRSAPLWFAGYLLVYNADRLYLDPADRLNTPMRFNWSLRLRSGRTSLVWLSGAIVAIWPLLTGRSWLLVPLAVVFGTLCFYSRPLPGGRFRLKDLPYLKSLLAPATIALSLVSWPALESGNVPRWKEWLVFLWVFLLLTINALVFDYRDIAGDKLTGIRTIPVLLGPRWTGGLLAILSGIVVILSIALSWLRLAAPLMTIALTLGCAVLLFSLRGRMSPTPLSVLADLLLFLPAAVEWLGR